MFFPSWRQPVCDSVEHNEWDRYSRLLLTNQFIRIELYTNNWNWPRLSSSYWDQKSSGKQPAISIQLYVRAFGDSSHECSGHVHFIYKYKLIESNRITITVACITMIIIITIEGMSFLIFIYVSRHTNINVCNKWRAKFNNHHNNDQSIPAYWTTNNTPFSLT